MAWTIEYTKSGVDSIGKLDKPLQREIKKYLNEHIAKLENPRSMGHALRGKLAGLWTYSFRKDYRIVSEIHDRVIKIAVVKVAHRSDVYK